MAIPAHQQDKTDNIKRVYRELDSEIEVFKAATALGCVNGCGRCCENPDVCATLLEVLPLVYELWQNGQAEVVLEKIQADEKGWCVFYQPDPLVAGKGRCSVYPHRPLICRLFGFSTKNDKYGRPDLVTCSTMKSHCASEYARTEQLLKSGQLAAPRMQDHAMKIFNIDPSLGQEQLPINKAVAIAIEKVGLFFQKD